MTTESNQTIAVIGAGAMGRGIAQLFAQSGHRVKFYDTSESAVESAHSFVTDMFDSKVDKGRISREEAERATANLVPCTQLGDVADCDLVVEAVLEDLEVKRGLFAALETVVSPSAVIASNTSSLLIADIAARCKHPERVAGLHFFNPVPVMRVVEIISSVRTADSTVERLKACIATTGHRAVLAQDQPGFLINHAGRGLYTEGLRILEEQAASHDQVDLLMREAAGFRMGPFELLDLTGLDVSSKVMQSIYDQFQQEPRFRPSSIIPPRVAAGLFGRKTGEGWYQYQDGKKPDPADAGEPSPTISHDCSVWIDPTADRHAELSALSQQAGARLAQSPDDASLLLIQPWGIDVSQACADLDLDARRCVAVDPLPSLDMRRTLMLSPITRAQSRDDAAAILGADNAPYTIISDSPGFVVQRMLATIVNIGTNIAQRGIASVEDIDDAVRIGLGYPAGPLALGDSIGPQKVMQILEGMQRVTGDPRYRPSHWLRRRAQLGENLTTREAARH
ncbi:MAG: 3-hydroxyacyl-CoA dehydrogenase [Gammaproteobacteria bacterium]